MHKRNLFFFVFLMMLALVPFTVAQDTENTDVAKIRLAHFSPDVRLLDLFINERRVEPNFSYREMTQWRQIEAGTIQVTLTPTGESREDAAIKTVELEIEPEKWYTLAVIGQQSEGTLQVTAIEENFSEIAPGETRITIFNGVDGGFPISVFARDTLLAAGVAYPGTQGDNDGVVSIDIVADTYPLLVESNGITTNQLYSSNPLVLGVGRHYFLAAVGTLRNESVVFQTTDVAAVSGELNNILSGRRVESTRLRVGNFAPGSPPLELYLNEERVQDFPQVEYAGISQWIELDAEVYQIALAPAGMTYNDAIVGPFNTVLESRDWHTLAIVTNPQSERLIGRIIREDYTPIPQGEARVTFFHAVPDVTAIDVMINGDVIVSELNFPGSAPSSQNGSANVSLVGGEFDINFTEAGEVNSVLLELSDVSLLSGNNYFIAAINTQQTMDYYLQSTTNPQGAAAQ